MAVRARSSVARPVGAGRRPVASSCEGVQAGQLVEIQRSRLLAGAAAAIDEYGYADTTVESITSRSRVSRRTFYELFENREACLVALLESVIGAIEGELRAARLGGLGWRERVRGGLWVILSFLDREPASARMCVVQALRGGSEVLGCREAALGRLAAVVDEGCGVGTRGVACSRLTAEGVVGAAVAIVHARLVRGEREPLTELLGELTGLIVLPYLGAGVARREQSRPAPVSPLGEGAAGAGGGGEAQDDPLAGMSMRLTYRTARALECIAQCPGVCNRDVSERAGVVDQGQVSRLLRRLERLGLAVNSGAGHAKGEPNAWSLTATGEGVVRSIRLHACRGEEAA
jgi:AcrR family transcriptional regulator